MLPAASPSTPGTGRRTWMTLKPVVTPAPTACADVPPEASASVRALISRRIRSRVSDSAPMSSLRPGRSSSHLCPVRQR